MTDNIFTKLTELRERCPKIINDDFSDQRVLNYVYALIFSFDTLKAHHDAAERFEKAVDEAMTTEAKDGYSGNSGGMDKGKLTVALEAYRNAIK